MPIAKQTMLKNVLRNECLPALSGRAAYFSMPAVRGWLRQRAIGCPPALLREYLSEFMQRGVIHDAGRGWYSSIAKELTIDHKPVQPLVKLLQKQYPLLPVSCWSTRQINPFMHHLFGKFFSFVATESDAVETVGEFLGYQGYDVWVNPTGSEKRRFAIHDKTVVVWPGTPWKSFAEGPFAPLEIVLVDLFMVQKRLPIMDLNEFHLMLSNVLEAGRINMARLKGYLKDRKQNERKFSGTGLPIIAE